MEVDTSRHAKRKRSPDPFALKKRKAYMMDGSAIEQCSNGPSGGDREKARSEARVLYGAFDVLCGASGAAESERRRACVDVIFKAASGGCKHHLRPTGEKGWEIWFGGFCTLC